jgi:dihydrofolate reductase
MTKVHAFFSISIDGYGAGPDQSVENPLGAGGESLHEWIFPTQTFKGMYSDDKRGTTGIDDDLARRSMANMGAWILGRNMFTASRGPWPDDNWKGWWGDNPPYHVPVYVLTHHPRESIAMAGGTTFHFVTDGIDAALDRARNAAGGKDIRIGGGVATLRAYLQARHLDELNLTISPILLGRGEHLFAGLDLRSLGYAVKSKVASDAATHVLVSRSR